MTRPLKIAGFALGALAMTMIIGTVLLRARPDLDGTSPPESVDSASQVLDDIEVEEDSSPSDSIVQVAPLLALDRLVEIYEHGIPPALQAEIALREFRETFRNAKASGETLWGSENWMKSRQYYESLETTALAEECFDRPTFYFTMRIYDNPRFAFARLEIMHEGFAELFRRDDMWKGLVHAFDVSASRLVPESDLMTIIQASGHLDALSRNLYLIPEFQDQVRGHEQEFYEASFSALKSFRDYILAFDPQRQGASIPFFGEADRTAEGTLLLLSQIDPERYDEIAPKLKEFRMSPEQSMDELREFLDMTIEALEKTL